MISLRGKKFFYNRMYRPLEYFKQGADNLEIAKMRMQHYEKRRRNKLAVVLNTVNEVINKGMPSIITH